MRAAWTLGSLVLQKIQRLQRHYFHRARLCGCGCGYDGLWIYPSQCAGLRSDVITDRYRGY